MTQTKGKLIVIEGLDGSGKGTQTKILVDDLKNRNLDVIELDFPSYGDASAGPLEMVLGGNFTHHREVMMKKDPGLLARQISSAYTIDRVCQFMLTDDSGKTLFERYDEGAILIANRYTTSNILFQARLLNSYREVKSFIDWIEDMEYNQVGLIKPDLVLYLDVTPEISMRNLTTRYGGLASRFDVNENMDVLKSVYDKSLAIVKELNWDRCECTNGQEMLPSELISRQIIEKVLQTLTAK